MFTINDFNKILQSLENRGQTLSKLKKGIFTISREQKIGTFTL